MGLLNLFKPDVYRLENKKNIIGLCRALSYKPKDHIRGSAAWALGNLLYKNPDSRAKKPLIKALQDTSEEVREKAAYALRYLQSEDVVNALNQSLNHPVFGTNISAIESLGIIGNDKAVMPLIKKLHESLYPNSFLKSFMESGISLKSLSGSVSEPIQRDVQVPVGKALRMFNDARAIEAYFKLVHQLRLAKSPKYDELMAGHNSYSSYNSFYDMKNVSAPIFLQVLNSQNPPVVAECLDSLHYSSFDNLEICRRLLELANYTNKDIQDAAIKNISKINNKQCLQEMLKSYNESIVSIATSKLKNIAEIEEKQRIEAAKPDYVKLIERDSGSDYGKRKTVLFAAEDHAAELDPKFVIRIVEIYESAAHESHNKYFSFYKEGVELLPIAERVIRRLAAFPRHHDALRAAGSKMYSEWNSFDPMADDSAYQLAAQYAYKKTYQLIEQLIK